MKRKIIIFSVLLILFCAGFYFIRKHYNRVENRVLRDVKFNADFFMFTDALCRKYKLPVVLECSNYSRPPVMAPRISYSAKKTTVRQLLDAVIPKEDFIWEIHGNVVHIISKELASRPDYQMNSVIEHFSAKDVDRNTLIKLAVAQAGKGNASEPLVYGEFPYKRFNVEFDPPKISIDAKHATLREILDQISRKADFCYSVKQSKNYDVSFSTVPYGSYALWIMLPDDLLTSGIDNAQPALLSGRSNVVW